MTDEIAVTLVEEAQRRRRELMGQMEPDSIALVGAAPQVTRSNDTEYPYRQNSDFFYLTAFEEHDAVLALIPGREQGEVVLFCQERDPTRELWDGILLGPERACEALRVDDAFPIGDIDDILPGLIEGRERVYYAMGRDPKFDQRVTEWVNTIRGRVRTGAHPPGEFMVLDHLLHEMRLIKSDPEVELMARAAQISARAHERAMLACREGLCEYSLEAELQYEFLRSGAKAPAYNSIVASGANACILHYVTNRDTLKNGDLVLIDAGCEYHGYASDITRTFPVSGRFSEEQKALYDIVLEANLAAIDTVRPGAVWDEPHAVSVRIITEGLVRLGLLKGDVDMLIEEGAFRDFYMHRVGHWLGLDVHDVGDYKIDDSWRLLEPGMVTTIEPGIYVSPDNTDVDSRWRGIGIRIEDDVLVTRSGQRVLSEDVPKSTEAIETLMAGT
ncbi:MAG: Xaa-Pro aminopeptidase [Pseudomonadota bacterium]